MLHNRKFEDDFKTFRIASKSFIHQLTQNRFALKEYWNLH